MAQKATRKTINLTSEILITGWMVEQTYYMSGTDATKVLKKHRESMSEWMRSIASNVLSDKDKSMPEVNNPDGKGGKITLYTTNAVEEYWLHWCGLGNTYARAIVRALMGNSLDRLYDTAFQGRQKSENEYDNQRQDDFIERLQASRQRCRDMHSGFQATCKRFKYPAAPTHNAMTMRICGLDANMARELEQILEGEESIGLNHYQERHDLALRQLAVAKRVFSYMHKNELTRLQRVDKAVAVAKKEVKI